MMQTSEMMRYMRKSSDKHNFWLICNAAELTNELKAVEKPLSSTEQMEFMASWLEVHADKHEALAKKIVSRWGEVNR